ncbi:MAG: hypothetical protein ACXVCY_08120 [Pseudobdellovibrionaceae bacterium]
MMKAKLLLKTKALSAALFTFFISSHAFSISQINSEFEMLLPRQFQQTMIDKKWETLVNKEFQGNWQFPDQQMLSQDVPVNIKNISLKINSFLQKPTLGNPQDNLQVASKNLRAEMDIGEVSVDHVVERNVGGIIGRFRIQASCKNVVLTLTPGQGSFAMVVSPDVQGATAVTKLESFSLSWLPGAWTPQTLVCDGTQGFTDVIKAEISKLANDSAQFLDPQKNLIRAYIEDYLKNMTIDFSQPKQLVLSRPDIQVQMMVNEYKDLGQNGASLRGQLQISFLKVATNQVKALTLSDPSVLTNSLQASLRLPQDFIKEVASAAYAANTWVHHLTSDQLSGFSTLMNSRFYQWLLWPELENYSTSAKFLFDVFSVKDINVQGKGLTYQLKANFNSTMQAPRSGTYVPFMNFVIPFNSKVQLKIENEKVSTTFVNPLMGLTYKWDSSYIKKYDPNQKFSADTIRDRIVGSLWGKTVTMAIPSIPVTDDISLKVLKAAVPTGGQDIVIQLAP